MVLIYDSVLVKHSFPKYLLLILTIFFSLILASIIGSVSSKTITGTNKDDRLIGTKANDDIQGLYQGVTVIITIT